jgi:hypothetical protein
LSRYTWDTEYLKLTVTEIRNSMTENQKLGSYFLNTPLRP